VFKLADLENPKIVCNFTNAIFFWLVLPEVSRPFQGFLSVFCPLLGIPSPLPSYTLGSESSCSHFRQPCHGSAVTESSLAKSPLPTLSPFLQPSNYPAQPAAYLSTFIYPSIWHHTTVFHFRCPLPSPTLSLSFSLPHLLTDKQTKKRPLEEMAYLFTEAPWIVVGLDYSRYDTHDLENRAQNIAEEKSGDVYIAAGGKR